MKQKKSPPHRFVICIDNSEYPASLEMLKIYRALPDREAERDGDLRVIDESGEDYLYPSHYFILLALPRTTIRVLNKSLARALQPWA